MPTSVSPPTSPLQPVIIHPRRPSSSSSAASSSTDKPNLLPAQRRLRHLRGILCRNIELHLPRRPRSSTQDDDRLRTSWQSPSKLRLSAAVAQANGPHQSLSSNDLKDMAKKQPALRRRSTRVYHLGALEDSVSRQKRLEEIVDSRLVDVFFTLHSTTTGEPLYISEQLFQTMNANFAGFDLLDLGDYATLRLNSCVIRVYARAHGVTTKYALLIEYDVSLCCLQFIGKDIGNFHHPFPPNSVVVQLTDGYYTAFHDVVTHSHPAPVITASNYKLQTTCSYSTLLKLVTIEDVLRDTIHSREEIKQNIDRLLTRHLAPKHYATTLSESRQRLLSVQTALSTERKALLAARKHVSTLRQSITTRTQTMHRALQTQASSQNTLLDEKHLLAERKVSLAQLQVALAAQRQRICLDLQSIYPICSVDDETLRFTIRGIYLPATGKWDGGNVGEEWIATALGWTAHLVWLLSFYLGLPLRYPVQPVGGRSLIKDPVSIMMGSRTFPLYASGGDQHRFEYGVFLLNKDIEQLMNSQLLHLMDLRTTLANLKYLLLYLTTTTSAMMPPPPITRGSRRAEAIPMKKVLGIFGESGGGETSSAGSSYAGNGGGSLRVGFARLFGGGGSGGGNVGGGGSNNTSQASSLLHSG